MNNNIFKIVISILLYFCFNSCETSFEPISTSNNKIIFNSKTNSTQGGNGELYIIDTNGKNKALLTNNISVLSNHKDLSSDGSKIIFSGFDYNTYYGTYIMNIDGSDLRLISPENRFSYFYDPYYSPDGTEFVCHNSGDLLIVEIDGSNPKVLLKDIIWLRHPRYTGDGEYIIFEQKDNEVNNRTNLFAYDIIDSSCKKITNNYLDWSLPEFDVSPVESKVVYCSELDGNLYILNLENGNKIKLNQGHDPHFSPDGNKISFISFPDYSSFSIDIINIDGSNHKRLVNMKYYCRRPQISPDNNKVVFSSEEVNSHNRDIFIIDINGKNLKNLTNSIDADDCEPIFVSYN
jgi:Tol biopolymer transport system component